MRKQKPPAAGDVLSERYALKREEWTSPLGPVWLARDRVLDRAVFVQMLGPELAGRSDVRKAFQRAAAESAQTAHASLLRVFDIGNDPAFVVFEHAAGGRLVDRLRTGPMRPTDAVRAALSLARALEVLHERGDAHAWLSPANVLFDDEGRAKLLSLGIPQVAEVAGVDILGDQPASYRPPEADPMPADADLFSLAALAAHMVGGTPPVPGAARQRRRGVPPAVDALLQRALDADPARRPSLDEFVAALAPFARIEPTEARGPRFAASEFRWLAPVAIILVLAALAVTVGVTLVSNLADRPSSSSTPTETVDPAAPLAISSVSDFDPEGDDEENPGGVGRSIDGDARTGWRTVGYATASFGNLKNGVGLLFDLGAVTPLGRLRIQSTIEGWEAQIRVANDPGAAARDFRRVARFTATTENVVPLPAETEGRYVLLWITALVDDGGGSEFPNRAEVAEVEFFAP